MTITESKITRQGQVTVPAAIRRKLGLAPGSVIEWREIGGEVVVTRASKYDSEQIHRALFSTPPEPRRLEEFDEGVRERMRRRHAGD
jgi:AbrB family looped-hinge helix DNA binding protein